MRHRLRPSPSSTRRLAVFFTILVAIVTVTPRIAGATPKSDAVGAARAFALPGRTNQTVAFDSLHAKVVLVDFWASWCIPCRNSFAWMNGLHERFGARGLAIVAINLDKDRPAAEKFLTATPASFTIAFDPAGKTASAYRVAAMPSTYLLAPDGAILVSHRGFDPKKTGEIESRIAEVCTP